MRFSFRRISGLILCAWLANILAMRAEAQPQTPIKWKFSSVAIDKSSAKVLLTASLDKGWHIYSQFVEEAGCCQLFLPLSPAAVIPWPAA